MPFVVRKIRNQNAYTVKNKITGKVHSHHTTKENAMKQVKLLRGLEHGMKLKGKGAKNINKKSLHDRDFNIPQITSEEVLAQQAEAQANAQALAEAQAQALAEAQALAQAQAQEAIMRLHRQFADLLDISYANADSWDKYDRFITSTGMTELQVAQLDIGQRRRLINRFNSTCVASGIKRKGKRKGGMIRRRRDKDVMYSREEAIGREVPMQVAQLEMEDYLSALQRRMYKRLLLEIRNGNLSDEDINHKLTGNFRDPELRAMVKGELEHDLQRTIGMGIRDDLRRPTLASLAFNKLPRRQQLEYQHEAEQGNVPRHYPVKHMIKTIKGRNAVQALINGRQEILQGANIFTHLPVAQQLAIIDDEDVGMESIKAMYRISGAPIPYEIIVRFGPQVAMGIRKKYGGMDPTRAHDIDIIRRREQQREAREARQSPTYVGSPTRAQSHMYRILSENKNLPDHAPAILRELKRRGVELPELPQPQPTDELGEFTQYLIRNGQPETQAIYISALMHHRYGNNYPIGRPIRRIIQDAQGIEEERYNSLILGHNVR